MIGVRLQGRLGNQMFQYAAARSAAERLRCGVAVLGEEPRLSLVRRITRPSRVEAEVGASFPNVTQSPASLAFRLGGDRLLRRVFPYAYEAPRVRHQSGADIEMVDQEFFRIRPGTLLKGFFQSESYFAQQQADVRNWYEPSAGQRRQLDAIVRTWPAEPDRMCAIHVRRTDYLRDRSELSDARLGLALPTTFYEQALSLLPGGLSFAVFSDDTTSAREMLSHVRPWESRGASAVEDLHLMSRCRFQIIANSSLSWWAAWLNRFSDKVIVAPKFHLGWRVGTWYPAGIETLGWSYVHVAPEPRSLAM